MLRALVLLLVATGAAAHPGTAVSTGLSTELAAASQVAELKSAHAAVDQALKVRKQRLDAWQKAQKLRDTAAADVARRKKAGETGSALEDALKNALTLDENAAHARSQLLAAESDVSSRGAALLKLYDALLVERRHTVESLPPQSNARAQAVAAYRDLASQRDGVRQALLPVLPSSSSSPAEVSADLPKGVDLEARPDDDVETLLEKADLARDLEERFLREAEAVRRRIGELEDEQAVQKGVTGMVGRSQLFDEEDRRLPVVRSETSTTTQSTTTTHASSPQAPSSFSNGAGAAAPGGADSGGVARDNPAPAPPPTTSTTSEAFALAPPAVVHGEGALAPPDAMAAMLSSPSVSVDSLKALEQKLKSRAQELDGKQKKLKAQAHAN